MENLPAEIYGDIKQVIVTIAENLKVPVEMLLTAFIKQGVVESITKICLILFLLICSIVMYKICLPKWKTVLKDDYASDINYILTTLTITINIILVISFFIVTVENLSVIITGLVNPEYRALELILKMVK